MCLGILPDTYLRCLPELILKGSSPHFTKLGADCESSRAGNARPGSPSPPPRGESGAKNSASKSIVATFNEPSYRIPYSH